MPLGADIQKVVSMSQNLALKEPSPTCIEQVAPVARAAGPAMYFSRAETPNPALAVAVQYRAGLFWMESDAFTVTGELARATFALKSADPSKPSALTFTLILARTSSNMLTCFRITNGHLSAPLVVRDEAKAQYHRTYDAFRFDPEWQLVSTLVGSRSPRKRDAIILRNF